MRPPRFFKDWIDPKAKGGNKKISKAGVCAQALEARLMLFADHLVFIQQPLNTHAGTTVLPPIVIDVDNSSPGIDAAYNGAITLTISAGVLNGTTTVAAFDGVAGFSNLSVSSPGVYRVFASGPGVKTLQSNLFTISPPLRLAFSRQPVNSIEGVGLGPVTVNVEDPDGNIITSDQSIITLSAAGASLGGAVSEQAVHGVAVFSTVFANSAGAYTLTATDGADAPATSDSFTVGPGPLLPAELTPIVVASTVPAVEITRAAEQGVVTVELLNQTASREAGHVSLALYLSADGRIDASSIKLLSTGRQVNLAPGASALEFLQVAGLPQRLSAGSYAIMAQATDPLRNAAASINGAAILLPAPFTQLQTAVNGLGQANNRPGGANSYFLSITNVGNAAFSGPIELELGLSTDDQTDAYPIRSTSRHLRLGAGASVVLTLSLTLPATLPAASYLPFVSITDNGVTTASVGGSVLTVH